MERTPVSSSMMTSIGYDPDTQTLEIEFSKSGAVWAYSGVPAEHHEGLMQAGSQGKYFHAHIKDKYPGSKT